MEKGSFLTVYFYHFDGFCGAISGAQTATDAETDIEHLPTSESLGNSAFDEGILASSRFLEQGRKHFFYHGRNR